ncbi:Protein CHROMATIN REMODELING 4 [Carex littledalei]|uniref:Protein CHROMATIN REMODELING 4 n=1 Tax=Carex littledalei TaxID=544730 RepID=A0A833VPG0_9POAL|nr:Protein CHROMATIN REMODELING 4 [Carex littledalei]
MMGGTVIFTYKRRRFSNKPHKIEELQPDPAFKPQVEDLINKSISQIESKKADEPKVELHRIDQAQTELCTRDEPQLELQNICKPFEQQKIEQSQIELLRIDEPENNPQIELQKVNEIYIELRTETQIINECPLEPDNIDEPQNEMQKIDEPHVKLPENVEPQMELQKVDESQIELQNPQSIDELQCKHKKLCETQLEQKIRDQIQLEPEKVGDEPEADPSAKPQIQELLNQSSEPRIESRELDEAQSDYSVKVRAEESHNETQEFQKEPQKIDKLQSGSSIKPPVADPSDEHDPKLLSPTGAELPNEDIMECDNGDDGASGFTTSFLRVPTDPDRPKQEMSPGFPNSDQTNDHILPNEEKLRCDREKPTLTSRQVRPEIDLTKLPTEAELETEMEALPPESISENWMDKEVQLLESLDKDLKAKEKQIKGDKLNFDLQLAPDLLSLQPTFDQDIFDSLQNQARPKPPKAVSDGTSLFGLPFPKSTMDPKGKNVNSLPTRNFFANPAVKDSDNHVQKQVHKQVYSGSQIFQEKLKYNNRYSNTYSTTSAYGACSYKLHDWSEEELDFLWIGVRRYGVNNWEAILRDPHFRFTKFKTVEDLAARWEVEQRRLFSCPLPAPVTHPLPRNTHWYSHSKTARPFGDQYLEGSSYRAYNSSSGRSWHQSVGPGMVPMPDLIPRRGRAKYQTRRAPKAQTVTRTSSPSISNQPLGNINISTRDNDLPHWLREVTEEPLGLTGGPGLASKELLNRGTVERKSMCDVAASEPLIEPNFKLDCRSSFDLSKKKSVGPNNLVILDSDGASSEETLSE